MNDLDNTFENKSSKRLSLKFWIIVVLLCTFLGFFLANARKNYNNSNTNTQNKEELGANITLHFDNDINTIVLDKFNPTKDYLGRSTPAEKCFDFNVDVHLKQSKHVTYELSLKKDVSSTIKDDDVHIYLEKKNASTDSYEAVFEPKSFKGETAATKTGTPAGSMVMNTLSVSNSGKDYYRLRMWLTDKSTVTSGVYKLEVVLNAIAD